MSTSRHENKLALGAVQFGLDYGIANEYGQVPLHDVRTILDFALNENINTLDTAIAYGNSEQVLGEVGVSNWDVITKLPPIPDACPDIAAWVNAEIRESLQRLNIRKLSGLLLHSPNQLLSARGNELYSALCEQKNYGLVDKIGTSIYEPDELNAICENFIMDIVQLPFNIFDRRILKSGWLSKLADKNIEIHVRSVMLQGLLLMSPEVRPRKFDRWNVLWSGWQEWLDDSDISPLQASLGFVLSFPEISKVVIGVDNVSQLSEIIQASKHVLQSVPDDLCCNDLNLINPSNWLNL